ncbi:hypothetical protein RCH10_005535 [Variovorax sp. GrIS 2.14]
MLARVKNLDSWRCGNCVHGGPKDGWPLCDAACLIDLRCAQRTNEAVLRATTIEALFQRLCSADIESGNFQMVAVCRPDAVTGGSRLSPSRAHQRRNVDPDVFVSMFLTNALGRSLISQAYRSSSPVGGNDFHQNVQSAPWYSQSERLVMPQLPPCYFAANVARSACLRFTVRDAVIQRAGRGPDRPYGA